MLPDIVNRPGAVSADLLTTVEHAAQPATNATSKRTRKVYAAKFAIFAACEARQCAMTQRVSRELGRLLPLGPSF